MKRTALATIAVLLLAPAVASALMPGLAEKGFKGGLSMAKFTGDDADLPAGALAAGAISPDSRSGLAFGGYLIYALTPMLALQPELLYVNKGARYEAAGTIYVPELEDVVDYEAEAKFKLDYLEIPLLLRLEMGSGPIRPFFLAGPYVALKLGAKVATEVTVSYLGVSATEEGEEDLDDVKPIDVGGVIGAGLALPLRVVTLSLEARYSLGFTSFDDSADPDDLKNSAVSLMAGFGF